MAFKVTDFKSQLGDYGGGARPSLYTIDINGPSGAGLDFSNASNLLVKAAAIPASTIAALPVNFMGRAYKTPGLRTFDVWNVTVLNDEDMAARSKIIKWMLRLGGGLDGSRTDSLGGKVEEGSDYEGDATVKQMGKDGSAKQSWKIHQMWPTELGEIGLSWADDAIEEYTIGFAYDYWSHGEATLPSTPATNSIVFT